MKTIKYPSRNDWSELLKRPAIESVELEKLVQQIVMDVQQNGDAALKKYTREFDKVELLNLQVSEEEFSVATKNISEDLKKAIQVAKINIEKFHASQKEEIKVVETTEGVLCWRKSVAIEKVGLYIPGGSAPLFSTILMLGVPAQIAGCKEIVLCTPANQNGIVNDAILYTAQLLGIKKVFKLGGVQAIGAMAYGTETVPKVYKIFGPGNQYVTSAKQYVSKAGVAIDMPAGPSELAMLVDNTCNPQFVAADLLSQAEHGADSQVVLVSSNEPIIKKIIEELEIQLELLPRKAIALKALDNSKAIVVKDNAEGMDLLNAYAPEHLIIACENDEGLAEKVMNAGSVFLGNYSCESAGDYASGTNHTLPTNGNAKAYSGVSLDSFVKKITFQKITEKGMNNIGHAIELMAEAEGLEAHKNAVSVRLKK
ncbi:MAG: histidinol dehydrogenase [Bacteroidetes bacterium]|nr:histidinol dehydrogenase [Bacteroidota bacterium]